jgi:IPT/TIG domain
MFSPTSGPVGTSVVITGESFTQATAVTLAYEWPMKFTVGSDTKITATVPANGTTGEISVRTPGGRAASTDKFTVTP